MLKVFVELYREGLIYKDKRLVNWDPKLLTAISDLEVVQVETKGHLWHLRYPIEGKTFNPDDPSTFIVVATTRPETMLGDTAVAVHPDDERYKELVGKNVDPAAGRAAAFRSSPTTIPIRRKGSGAVKITPAHDFNDFEVGKRHNLPHGQYPDTSKAKLRSTRIRTSISRARRRAILQKRQNARTAWTVSPRASRSSRGLRKKGWWRRSSRTRTSCRTATARTW